MVVKMAGGSLGSTPPPLDMPTAAENALVKGISLIYYN